MYNGKGTNKNRTFLFTTIELFSFFYLSLHYKL